MVCPWNHDSCAKTYQLGLGLNPGTWVFTGKTCWYLWMFILTFRCKIRTLYQLYWKSYSYIYSHIWRLPSTQLETFIYCDSSPQVLFPSSAILVPQSLMGESWRIKPYVYYCAVPDEKKRDPNDCSHFYIPGTQSLENSPGNVDVHPWSWSSKFLQMVMCFFWRTYGYRSKVDWNN
jgi:hypothetical protein